MSQTKVSKSKRSRRNNHVKKVGVTASRKKHVQTYVDAVRWAGLEPVVILPNHNPGILQKIDGIVFTGGPDINPKRYGQEPAKANDKPNDKRDQFELKLMKKALARNMPVFAICRGLQLLNVLKGGTLIQDLPNVDLHRVKPKDKSEPAHSVRVLPGSRIARIVKNELIKVNSRHHQAIDKLGANLRPCVFSEEDGVVEGVSVPGKKFVIGVQWHPENELDRSQASRNLFRAFAKAL